MSRLIHIDGIVEIKDSETHDDFLDKFIQFIEANGWTFGGGSTDVTDEEDK